ncbi:unnamed protein product, partial [Prunus brigantina]
CIKTKLKGSLSLQSIIKYNMEAEADVMIVGAGISGLATSLVLHRLGIGSFVLESSDSLRTTGITGLQTFEMSFKAKGKQFSSKVVSVDESGYFKLVHLADGTILKAKSLSEGQDALAPATYPTSLERRALRKAGFTEQRLPPSLGSGRITGRCHLDPPWPARLSQLNQNLFDCGKLSIS